MCGLCVLRVLNRAYHAVPKANSTNLGGAVIKNDSDSENSLGLRKEEAHLF